MLKKLICILCTFILVCFTGCEKNTSQKDNSLLRQKTISISSTSQLFKPLMNFTIFPYNGGRDKVLFEFKSDCYRSIDEYKSLNQFCTEEISDCKKVKASISIDVARHDFNDDGIADYLLRISSAVLYGNSGSMCKLILCANDGLRKEIDLWVDPSNLAIMKSKSNGLHDIGSRNDLFHSLSKYDGKNSYCVEDPCPLIMTNFLASKNNWEVKNGKLFIYSKIRIGGDIPSKANLPFYVGIKIDSLSPYIKSSDIWAYDKNGNILTFNSLNEQNDIDTFVFSAEISSDENKVIQAIKNNFIDGYVFPDDFVFACSR